MSSSLFPVSPVPVGSFSAHRPQIFRQINQPAISPGTTGNDNVLAVITLPASIITAIAAGIGVTISAVGNFGATANNKRLKLILNPTTAVVGSAVVGGTTIADSAVVATNGGTWSLVAKIIKYGAVGSNTQLAINILNIVGTVIAASIANVLLTMVENSTITIAVTGNATTATTDILFSLLEIDASV